MKRLLCLLLTAALLISFCACADKKNKETDKGSTEETQTTEDIQKESGEKGEEIATAPDQSDEPKEIGTLPIIFEDDDSTQNNGENGNTSGNSTSTPSTTTKKPATTTKTPATSTTKSDSGLTIGGGNVVETPIIPFN